MLNNKAKQRDWIADMLGLTALFIVFYLCFLGTYPLFTPDEGRYSEVAREMVATGDYITPRVDGVVFLDKPILYYWLQAIAIKLFGVKEWSLRLFPALFGIFGCLMVYFAGRQLFDRRTGLLAATMLATSPLYFCGAHYANLDLEVAVLMSGALLGFVTFVHEGIYEQKGWLLIFAAYLFAGLAFLTKGMIGIVIPGMVIGAWMLLQNRFDLLKKIHLIAGIIIFAAIVTPWYVLVQKANPDFLHYFFITQQVTRFLSAAEFNNPTPVWFYIPIVFIGFFPWTIFLIQSLNAHIQNIWWERNKYSVQLFLLLWVVIVFVFFSIPRSKTMGYIFPIFPPLALLVANYLSSIWEKPNHKAIQQAIVYFVTTCFLLSVFLLMSQHYHWLNFTPAFKPYMFSIAIIFIVSTLLALFFSKKETIALLFTICILCSVLFLLILTKGAVHLNQNSAKPLVTDLKTILKPEDEVVAYYKYYHDVPLYLGQLVTIVTNWQSPDIAQRDNWTREMWFGMQFQKDSAQLIDDAQFWQRWESRKRLFVFLNLNYMSQFKARAKSYYLLGKHNDILLLSNKPTKTYSFKTHPHGEIGPF